MIEREENFYEAIYRIFYDFSQSKPEIFGLELSRNLEFPILKSITRTNFVIPLPKLIGEKYVFEGLTFENNENARRSIWTLFLSTVYHLAGHAAVSNYSKYENWIKNKTKDIAWTVIDFIEDIAVGNYIQHANNGIWDNIQSIDERLMSLQTVTKQTISKQKHQPYRSEQLEKMQQKIKNKILTRFGDNDDNYLILEFADFLYQNRELLPRYILPHHEHHTEIWPFEFDNNMIDLESQGMFAEQANKLNELWEIEEQSRARIFRRYKKHLKNLNFDTVIIPPGNLQSFAQIQSKTLPMLRRIRQQIKMISNLTDDPKIDQIGYLDMQMAIQAIASEGQSIDIFERDELRRGEEAWVILVDKSASMELRFNELKEFAVCVSESANELTGKYDAWALYSFDNNFQILKDFKEKYNQEVQARLGNLEKGGLTLLPDAIELATRVLSEDPREKKYIFVITDGSPSGYDRIQEAFSKVTRKVDVSEVALVAIGVSKTVTKAFKNSARGKDLRQLVAKFITSYRSVSSDM